MKSLNHVVALDAAATIAELNYKDEAFITLKELLISGDMRIKIHERNSTGRSFCGISCFSFFGAQL